MTMKTTILRELARAGLSAVALMAALPVLTGAPSAKAQEEEDDAKTVAEAVEDYDRIEGLFVLYRDPKTGDVYMELTENQLGAEFIVFSYVENGVLDAGFFRGAYAGQQIVKPVRYFDKIDFVEESTAFYFDPEKAIARAANANISPSLMASLKIEAETPATDDTPARLLVKANDLFLSEAIQQIKPSPNPNRPADAFSPGEVAGGRYAEINNYPENTDIVVDYQFQNKYPTNGGGDAVTDPRSLTVQIQHSLIKVPDTEGFEPRIDDYRIGYFFDKVTDLSSDEVANYRDLINKWRLVKKDPDAALSEPEEPITWWVENTTPREYRDTIRDAVLAWNRSFEKAGFRNAVEVRIQPDDAEWAAGDIRYNVLRWTSSPQPPFGGYGPSFSNPRTGEILGADIMLEYVFIKNRLQLSEIFDLAATQISLGEGLTIETALDGKHVHCSAGHTLMLNNLFGRATLQAQGLDDDEENRLITESLYYLLLHEVGHTLGLNHNMKASVRFGPREVHDPSVTQGAPTGSVMDYPAINMAPLGMKQGDYYMQKPGPYDDWAIEFGYRPGLEGAAREALLARAGEPGLEFGNDADDMRAPGRGIDPRVNINDMSSDPVAYAVDRIRLAQSNLTELVGRFDDKGSWADLVQAYLVTSGQHAAMATVISRQIGGVYVDRLYPEQQGDIAPYRPVPLEKQKAAMMALADHVYAEDAFALPIDLAARLQPQRRGFDFFEATEDPKIHDRVLSIQTATLAHLLNPVVIKRMVDSSLYGNAYLPADMLIDLNAAIIGDDLRANPNAFRRNLQIAYVEQLVDMAMSDAQSAEGRSAALGATEEIKGRFGLFDFNLNPTVTAHRAQISQILKRLDQ